MRALLIAIAVVACASCGQLPRDPHHTLEHVRGNLLRVGVTENRPWVIRRGDEATGLEAEVVRGFASSLGARVQWIWNADDVNLRALEQYDVDLVAAGLEADSPWSKKVAVTRPYIANTQHVLVLASGENATLLALERYLAEHREQIAHDAEGLR
jgi:polar amino acid transport system substrate-binding protein